MHAVPRRSPRRALCFFKCARSPHSTCRVCAAKVLDVRLPYDERQLLVDNTPYLLRTLRLDAIHVHPVTDAAAVAAAAEKVDPAQALPGLPVVVLTKEEAPAA